jgi:UDP-N-acetylglucosamine 2-epimerase (non-hydrolysing)
MSTDLAFVLGTRPEIIKLSPVIREAQDRDVSFIIIHTGQHYSENLDTVFFDQLNLPKPDYNLTVGSKSSGQQTSEMIAGIEEVLQKEEPETVLVQGDTNSVLAGSIATSKLPDISLGHIEAGLRSYNRKMPEEINRRLSDQVADYHFAPTDQSEQNLLDENIAAQKITVTGNTIVDAVQQNKRLASEESRIMETLDIDDAFALLTAHREENVDSRDRFRSLLSGVARAGETLGLPIIYPTHPRAADRLEAFDIDIPDGIELADPLDFFDFLVLQNEATLVFTDSGGVQEESCILMTPCVTLREETERPETVDVGANTLVGTQPEDVVSGAEQMIRRDNDWQVPLGDGTAAEMILETLGYEQ